MNKAILLIDMPDNCNECPLAVETLHCYDACCVTGSKIISSYGKFPWCPLKSMPKFDSRYTLTSFQRGYQLGWNQCMLEILETEDK